jgi:branched-subunit amino acid transport protein
MRPDNWFVWALILGMAISAFFVKAVFLLPGNRLQLPPTLERILRYAPAAALMAIIVPGLAMSGGTVSLGLDNARWLAGLVGFTIAFVTRNIVLTIVGGMMALALFGWAAG